MRIKVPICMEPGASGDGKEVVRDSSRESFNSLDRMNDFRLQRCYETDRWREGEEEEEDGVEVDQLVSGLENGLL